MSKHIKAPGRSVLWTEATLRALTSSAWTDAPVGEDDEDPLPMTPTMVDVLVGDAIAIADRFETACIARHAREQAAVAAAHEAWVAEKTAEVLRVGRYPLRGDALDTFHIVREVSMGRVIFTDGMAIDLHDLVVEEMMTPAPLDEAGDKQG